MANSAILSVFLPLLVSLHTTEPAKILFYTGRGEGSHYASAAFLAEELVARNHEVTFLLGEAYRSRSTNPVHAKLFDFRFVETDAVDDEEYDALLGLMTKFGVEGKNLAVVMEILNHLSHCEEVFCRKIFEEGVLETLEAERYDLIFIEPTVFPCGMVLGEYLHVKMVALVQTSMNTGVLRAIGHIINPSTVSSIGLGFPTEMNLAQRAVSFLMASYERLIIMEYVYRTYFHQFGTIPFTVTLPTVDLVVSYSDPLVDKVVPIYPGHITAGGFTTRPAGPLEQDYEEFMQSSGEHGVIVFTLGSYVVNLPLSVLEVYRDAFATLPQKVIWQMKNGTLRDIPRNVRTSEWIPQNDLLGHNKTRLLIYQGGVNGLYEAIYHGVPLIVMPIFFDQHDTAQNVVEKEIGRRIHLAEATGEYVRQQILTVLEDEKYKRNMVHISTMYRDRPQTPVEKTAYWVEHILKYGSNHLQIPGRDMSFIQYYLLDVIGFLICCVALTIVIAFVMLKFTLKLILYVWAARKTKKE